MKTNLLNLNILTISIAKLVCLFALVIFSTSSFSEELTEKSYITDQSFIGQWCGEWDETYPFCITIDSIESGAMAKYKWKEHPNKKFDKAEKKIERVNLNTLKIDNIWFVLDERQLSQANAIGVFRIQSRIAVLEKISAGQN